MNGPERSRSRSFIDRTMRGIRSRCHFEYAPAALGIACFLVIGVGGYMIVGRRDVLLPTALLVGIVAGASSSSSRSITNNAIVATVIGFLLVVAILAPVRVASVPGGDQLGTGDAILFGTSLFVVEAIVTGVVILLLGYLGAFAVEIVGNRWGKASSQRPRELKPRERE